MCDALAGRINQRLYAGDLHGAQHSLMISISPYAKEKLRDLLVDGPDLSVVEDRQAQSANVFKCLLHGQGVVVRGLQEVPTPSLQHAMEAWLLYETQLV